MLAFGAELKGSFAIYQNGNIYVSQYLGDQQSFESQIAFTQSMTQLTTMMNIKPDVILADSHPGYHSSSAASAYSLEHDVKNLLKIQHHKAHFSAVLAENSLLNTSGPILGIIWDGTGYGDDHQIWGRELFLYENGDMRRLAHLKYFNHLMNDTMSREPRLSALSLLKELPAHQHIIESYFNDSEWKYYLKVLSGKPETMTSSMGRFLDGIACILGVGSLQTYEGETVMKMEALARQFNPEKESYYDFEIVNGEIQYIPFLEACIHDFVTSGNVPEICRKVLFSLARLVGLLSDHFKIEKIAFRPCGATVLHRGTPHPGPALALAQPGQLPGSRPQSRPGLKDRLSAPAFLSHTLSLGCGIPELQSIMHKIALIAPTRLQS